MKNILLSFAFAFLFFNCSSDNSETVGSTVSPPINATEVNLAIGIKNDADLIVVLNTLNELNFDIRQMNGFFYNANVTQNGVTDLINLLNQKSYINTGAWSATPYSVYYSQEDSKTRILNSFFNMNVANQTDLLNLIAALNLEDRWSETKNIYLSVPVDSHTYWKAQMLTYPFVKWTETFDRVCISHQQANVSNAIVPSVGHVNQTISIPVTFQVLNGCGGFGNFIETNNENIKTVTVNAKYEGCYCTLAIEQRQATYNFTPTTAGTYTLNFTQTNGNVLTYIINIQ